MRYARTRLRICRRFNAFSRTRRAKGSDNSAGWLCITLSAEALIVGIVFVLNRSTNDVQLPKKE